jgi:hypothetical protein
MPEEKLEERSMEIRKRQQLIGEVAEEMTTLKIEITEQFEKSLTAIREVKQKNSENHAQNYSCNYTLNYRLFFG